ncbi:MAG: hypothetical protein HXY40_11810 [Chloroflexi bacterium]|nr:hypothetical protein [Chloroflexota bacterium]
MAGRRNDMSQLRTRAFENMLGIAMCNYRTPAHNGHLVAFDGIAFAPDPGGGDGTARDMLLIEAGEQEGIFMAAFDLAALRDYRERETWGNSYRKPHVYRALTAAAVVYPFIRHDSRH